MSDEPPGPKPEAKPPHVLKAEPAHYEWKPGDTEFIVGRDELKHVIRLTLRFTMEAALLSSLMIGQRPQDEVDAQKARLDAITAELEELGYLP